MNTRKKYVAGFLFSENRTTVALIEKTKPEWQAGKLNGIGGKIEDGENIHSAMEREFKEETGVDFEKWHRFATLEGPDWVVYLFVGFGDEVFDVQTTEEEKVSTYFVDQIHELEVIPNLLWLIPMALDSEQFNATVEYV